jgi:hypothetical protein
MPDVRIGLNVSGQNTGEFKKVASDIKKIGQECETSSAALSKLDDVVKSLISGGSAAGQRDAWLMVVGGVDKYSSALRVAAAELLKAVGVTSEMINQLLKTGDAHDFVAKALEREARAAAKAAKEQQQLIDKQKAQIDALTAKLEKKSARNAELSAKEQVGLLASISAEKRMEDERRAFVEDRAAKNKQRYQDEMRGRYAAIYAETRIAEEQDRKRTLNAEKEEQKRTKASQAATKARLKAEEDAYKEDDKARQRSARALLQPNLGIGGNRMPSWARLALSGASIAAGTPGGTGGQVGILSEATALMSKLPLGAMIGVAAGLELVSLTAQFARFTVKVSESELELKSFSERLGLTADQGRRLRTASELLSINFASLEAGAKKLAAGLDEPTGAGRVASDALNRLGISTRDMNGEAREVGPVLLEFLKTISKIPSETERIRLSNVVLGRESRELLPLIKNYEELEAAATKMAGSVESSINPKFVEFRKEVNKLTEEFKLFGLFLASGFIDAVEPAVKLINSIIDKRREAAGIQTNPPSKESDEDRKRRNGLSSMITTSGGLQLMLPMLSDPAEMAKRQLRAETYAANELLNDDDAIRDELSKVKKKKRDLSAKLKDPNLTTAAANTINQSMRSESGRENELEERLKFLGAQRSIDDAILSLKKKAESIATEGKKDRVDIDVEALVDKKRYFTPEKKKRLEVVAQELRDAYDTQDDRKIIENETRSRISLRYGSSRLDLRRSYEMGKLGEDDSRSGRQASLEKERDFALKESLSNYREAIEAAKTISERVAHVAAITAAESKKELADKEAKLRFEMASLQLAHEEKKVREATAKHISDSWAQFGFSETQKNSDFTSRLGKVNAGFGEGAFAEVRAAKERLRMVQETYAFEMSRAELNKKEEDREKAQHEAQKKFLTQINDVERDHRMAMAELRKKEIEQVRDAAGKVFDGLMSGDMKSLIMGQGKVIGRTMFQNVAQEVFSGSRKLGLGGFIKGQTQTDADGNTSLTRVGRILAGTPLGVDTQQMALAQNSTQLQFNTAAMVQMTQVLSGLVGAANTTGVGSVQPGTVGLYQGIAGAAGAFSPGAGGIAGGAGGVLGTIFPTMPRAASTVSNPTLGMVGEYPGGSSASKTAGAFGLSNMVGVGTSALVGAMGVAGGISMGGARGGLQVAGSLAGAAGGIIGSIPSLAAAMPMFAPVALGIGAIALGIKALLGDPKKEREAGINQQIRDNRYFDPNQINISADTAGNMFGYDFMGGLSATPYSAYRWKSANAGYDQDWRQTPGTTSPSFVINISAMDGSSVMDRRADIIAAVRQGISDGMPLMDRIQENMGMAT